MNDIDGDDDVTIDDYAATNDDDEMSDVDSIRAMARRLDDASVISDPSFIEGTVPHTRGVDPPDLGGRGGGRGHGPDTMDGSGRYRPPHGTGGSGGGQQRQHRYRGGGGGGGGGGGQQQQRQRHRSQRQQQQQQQQRMRVAGRGGRLSSIASLDDEDDEDGRSSDDSSDSSDSDSDSDTSGGRDGGEDDDTVGGMVAPENRTEGRPMGRPRVGFHDDDDDDDDDRRGGGNGGSPSSSYSYSYSHDNRQQRRRGVGGVIAGTTGMHVTARSASGEMGNKSTTSHGEEEEGRGGGRKRRRLLIIGFVVAIMAIAVATAVALLLTGGGDDGGKHADDGDVEEEEDGRISITMPTSSPTYAGEYHCPPEYYGPVPTRDCSGYVECDDVSRNINHCPDGTLYDVDISICNHVDDVICNGAVSYSPNGPTTFESYADGTSSTTTTDATAIATSSIYVPPVLTSGHRLLFVGSIGPDVDVDNIDDGMDDDFVGALEVYLEGYISDYYSSDNLDDLDVDDELRNLSDVRIEVSVTDVVTYGAGGGLRRDGGSMTRRRRRLRRMRRRNKMHSDYSTYADVASRSIRSYAGGGTSDPGRRLQDVWSGGGGEDETPRFVAVYDQTTSYRTTDASVSIGAIVRRPFDPSVTSDLVERLRSGFPDILSTLSRIEYAEDYPTAETGTIATTTPSAMPTVSPTNADVDTMGPTTSSPLDASPVPTKRPAIETLAPLSEPVALTITGLLWLDEDENGLYDAAESPLPGIFVTLRQCEEDTWRGTVRADSIGQYVFTNLTEGEYYVDFLKPNDSFYSYEFTIPKIGGSDEAARDSDVTSQDSYKGQSECLSVRDGFMQLTNAGFVRSEQGSESESASKSPTKSPTKPLIPEFCAFVSGENFDFAGCEFPCENQDDCSDDMVCAFTLDCSA